jgi:hypothetical protein
VAPVASAVQAHPTNAHPLDPSTAHLAALHGFTFGFSDCGHVCCCLLAASKSKFHQLNSAYCS